MQIPYETTARPDTGLYNAKLGIWLFLASEVMLFGGLFSAYIFLRMGADDGYWPTGLLNVPVGTMNTAILIASSVTVVLAWAALKMRQWAQYKLYMGITIVCALVFLIVKVAYEWPEKYQHFGAFIKKDKWEQYEDYLGNKHILEHNLNHKKKVPPRAEITGHLHAVEVTGPKEALDRFAGEHHLDVTPAKADPAHGHDAKEPVYLVGAHHGMSPGTAEDLLKINGVKPVAFEVQLDAVNADPKSDDNLKAHFIPRKRSDKVATIKAEDISSWSAFVPKHSSYFAVYFTITGLHGLHVLGGAIVFIYFFFCGETLYRKNPEHMANRIEVSGLFWHFVDLVWIFVFPIFYLL
jgi:cytochrome c oxidase subunit III